MPTMTLEKLAIMVADGFAEVHRKIDHLTQGVDILKQDVAILKEDVREMKMEMRLQHSEITTLNLRTERLEKKFGI